MTCRFRIEIRNVAKSFPAGATRIPVLQDVNWDLQPGAMSVLLGASGSGKSTLINLIAGLAAPDAGRIHLCAGGETVEWHALADRERTRFRLRHIGVIYQFFNLLPSLTVWENVMLPLDLAGRSQAYADRARALLQEVGLASRMQALPQTLSGGEQQRVAIVRALANRPAIILADEPTGNLDDANSQAVMALLTRLCTRQQALLLVATHARELAPLAQATARLENGRLVPEG